MGKKLVTILLAGMLALCPGGFVFGEDSPASDVFDGDLPAVDATPQSVELPVRGAVASWEPANAGTDDAPSGEPFTESIFTHLPEDTESFTLIIYNSDGDEVYDREFIPDEDHCRITYSTDALESPMEKATFHIRYYDYDGEEIGISEEVDCLWNEDEGESFDLTVLGAEDQEYEDWEEEDDDGSFVVVIVFLIVMGLLSAASEASKKQGPKRRRPRAKKPARPAGKAADETPAATPAASEEEKPFEAIEPEESDAPMPSANTAPAPSEKSTTAASSAPQAHYENPFEQGRRRGGMKNPFEK